VFALLLENRRRTLPEASRIVQSQRDGVFPTICTVAIRSFVAE
jgi:hypothetical protein